MEVQLEKYYAEIRQRLASFTATLPRQIDPIALSRSKLPFKAISYRGTLIWRITELADAALYHFERKQFAAAVVLARACVETSAALWYLLKKLRAAMDRLRLDDIDDYLMRLTMGHKEGAMADFPDAINVNTFVKHVDKDIENFAAQYAVLSEYAHPNYMGTTQLYSHHDSASMLVYFGAHLGRHESAEVYGVINLSIALMLFEHSYEGIGALLPPFITLCESELPPLSP